jgi:hypothetical protein
MIVKDSQLHKRQETEWPVTLTPQQREDFLKEKFARVVAWRERQQKHDHKNPECS